MAKRPVVRRDMDVPKACVGRVDRCDLRQRQLLRQPVLQGLEGAFRAAARPWRIGRDMLDAQMREGASHLRRTRPVDLPASLGRVKIMAAAIRMEAQGQAMAAKHFRQGPECRIRAFLFDQKGRENGARRVVQGHDQVEPREPRQPGAARASRARRRADAASCRASAGADACGDALHAALPAPANPANAGTSWSRCSPRQRRDRAPDARENAWPRSRYNGCDKAPPPPLSDQPEPACPRPCPAAGPTDQARPPPRGAGANAGTSARPSPKSPAASNWLNSAAS
jgi:hypothetical protein